MKLETVIFERHGEWTLRALAGPGGRFWANAVRGRLDWSKGPFRTPRVALERARQFADVSDKEARLRELAYGSAQ